MDNSLQRNPFRRGHKNMDVIIHDDVRHHTIPHSREVYNGVCHQSLCFASEWNLRRSQAPSHKTSGTIHPPVRKRSVVLRKDRGLDGNFLRPAGTPALPDIADEFILTPMGGLAVYTCFGLAAIIAVLDGSVGKG